MCRERTVTDWIRKSVLDSAGMREPFDWDELRAAAEHKLAASLDAVRRGPFGAEFRERRRARLMLGTLRYESTGWCPRAYDVIGSAMRRIDAYEKGGNLEHMVDAANLIALEWLRPGREGPARFADYGWPLTIMMPHYREAYTSLWSYRVGGNRWDLARALDCLEAEYLNPVHPRAHWHDTHRGDADDVGGVPEVTP